MKDILLSIKPKHVAKILSGEKTWEFRRKLPRVDKRTGIYWIYSSAPTKKIVGCFDPYFISAHPKTLWEDCNYKSGCTRKEFMAYFKNCDWGHALNIRDLQILENPIDLPDGINAPQNFRYIQLTTSGGRRRAYPSTGGAGE